MPAPDRTPPLYDLQRIWQAEGLLMGADPTLSMDDAAARMQASARDLGVDVTDIAEYVHHTWQLP